MTGIFSAHTSWGCCLNLCNLAFSQRMGRVCERPSLSSVLRHFKSVKISLSASWVKKQQTPISQPVQSCLSKINAPSGSGCSSPLSPFWMPSLVIIQEFGHRLYSSIFSTPSMAHLSPGFHPQLHLLALDSALCHLKIKLQFSEMTQKISKANCYSL